MKEPQTLETKYSQITQTIHTNLRESERQKPHSANVFRPLLQMVAGHGSNLVLGLTIIPQEGTTAGLPSSTVACSSDVSFSRFQDITERFEAALANAKTPDVERTDINFVTLDGQFKTAIGYLWHPTSSNQYISPELLSQLANYILDSIENSKKATLNEMFIARIKDNPPNDLFRALADCLRLGLYCNSALIWELNGGNLRCKNEIGRDVPVQHSAAGFALQNGTLIVNDILCDDVPHIVHRDFLINRGIRSFFLIPVTNPINSQILGVAGVFYIRPYGTTHVDELLCNYVIQYYALLWSSQERLQDAEKNLQKLKIVEAFHKDAVRCLIDFHDITAIQMGLSSGIANALIHSHNKPEIYTILKETEKQVNLLKVLAHKHAASLRIAKDHKDLVSITDEHQWKLLNLYDLIEEEIAPVKAEGARTGQFDLDYQYSSSLYVMKIDPVDVRKVVGNLLQNAARSLKFKSQGKKNIRLSVRQRRNGFITIRVWDNGLGIESDKLEKIFEPHFTTHGAIGGKGLGLAIVQAIAHKNGSIARVKSEWGSFAEFDVDLQYKMP